jgi:hypothetical protein
LFVPSASCGGNPTANREQGRHRNQSPTTRDGVDEPGAEAGEEKKSDRFPGHDGLFFTLDKSKREVVGPGRGAERIPPLDTSPHRREFRFRLLCVDVFHPSATSLSSDE